MPISPTIPVVAGFIPAEKGTLLIIFDILHILFGDCSAFGLLHGSRYLPVMGGFFFGVVGGFVFAVFFFLVLVTRR